MIEALVDTGSCVSIIKKSFVESLGLKPAKMRNLPRLMGVTQAVVPVLGSVYVRVHIGKRVVTHLFYIVPDNLMDTEVLLGADILGVARLTWDRKKSIVIWNGITFLVRLLKMRPSTKRIRNLKIVQPSNPSTDEIRLKKKIVLPPSSVGVYTVSVNEDVNTVLEFESVVKHSGAMNRLCLKVSNNKEVYLPLVNSTKGVVKLRIGTLVGTYTKIDEKDITSVTPTCRKIEIKNDLIPESMSVESGQECTREEKLENLIAQQDWSHLNVEQQSQLKNIVMKHHQVFILDSKELGKFRDVQGHINISDTQPVRTPLYRYPEMAKKVIADMLEDMEAKDIIEPSTAAWLSPIVLVRKPDNSQRMCLDYRKVNDHLQVDIHPLPRLEELVESASGNQFYTSLDMKEAYYQLELDEESRDVTTFSDGVSLYRFKRLPFGLSCSPAIFSRVIGNVLAPLMKKGWIKNYLDDIVVWAASLEELLERLEELFKLFGEQGIKLNIKKCHFAQKEIKFLGHIISKDGYKPCPDNISAIKNMKAPTNVKETRRFLGMCGFYRKHIPKFAKIAVPLTNLLRVKEPFEWTSQCQSSFEQLKQLLITAPVLIKADVSKPFQLFTDASADHVGAVLMQAVDGHLKPIGYFSKKLKPAEQRYMTTDREALAIVLACRRFHHFLWGTVFEIHTDHQPLTSVFTKRTKCPRMSRWRHEMRYYRYKIFYRPGKHNEVADQLSRPVRAIFQNNQDDYLGLGKEEFKAKQMDEARWSELIRYLEGGKLPRKKFPRAFIHQFILYEGLLYLCTDKNDNSIQLRLVVPQELRKVALKFGHESVVSHLGRRKTIDALETYFYWPSLRSDVVKYVKECITCQAHKDSPSLQQKFQELPTVNKPLERISIDLTDMMSGANGYRYVLTIIDHYSRYVKFYPLRNKTTELVSTNFQRYLNDYGIPRCVILDNGSEFTSQQFKQLCHSNNINLGYITPYHPEGNSISERMHRTMKTLLNVMCQGHPYQWPNYLGDTQRVLNCAIHATTGEQPHFIFFCRRPLRQVLSELPSIEDDSDIAKAHEIIQKTSSEMSKHFLYNANKKRHNSSVEKDSLVWVKNETQIPGTSRKLNVKWLGPYKVIEVIREGSTYILKNLFNDSMLERAANKVKPFYGKEEWLVKMQEHSETVPDIVPEGIRTRGARNIVPPSRLIEEI